MCYIFCLNSLFTETLFLCTSCTEVLSPYSIYLFSLAYPGSSHRSPDFLLPSHFLQQDTEAFLSQLMDIVSPACPSSWNAENQQLNSRFFQVDRTLHPIFEGELIHPTEETYFSCLYPQSCCFGHYLKLVNKETRRVGTKIDLLGLGGSTDHLCVCLFPCNLDYCGY